MIGLLVLAVLAGVLACSLVLGARRITADPEALAQRIDALLPQTQCAQCGYPGCQPYARAIARGDADINQCPPGGERTIATLAHLLGREPTPLDPRRGEHKPRALARIDESMCIGCTICIQACPVDAIVGAAKLMHSVIEAECTGCELCVAPCPVDCIEMVPILEETTPWRLRRPPVIALPLAGRR
jgi:H+/Na+-translocating ferredoxin:NAD+ oxidoreductase subunit B